MTKAVFFDWFNTLAQYHPPREELHATTCREFGIEIAPSMLTMLTRGLLAADQYFAEENARSSVEKRLPQEKAEVYAQYESIILKEAGIEVPQDLALRIVQKVAKTAQGLNFTLFDDVLPVLGVLRQRGLILGLISNIDRDITPICRELGLTPYLDFVVTSQEAGADKPQPPIFLAALKKAEVKASEAIHIGDQYNSDVVGALGVGIRALLLDRYNLFEGVIDCPRIKSLTEVVDHL